MNDKTEGLKKARAERSLKKRKAVESAMLKMKHNNDTITFKSIALLAGVSRQYLYKNFKNSIQAERENCRSSKSIINGINVPSRTTDEYKHIEALLRNKITKLKKELGVVRSENARIKNELEKERGLSEHYRKNWVNARSGA